MYPTCRDMASLMSWNSVFENPLQLVSIALNYWHHNQHPSIAPEWHSGLTTCPAEARFALSMVVGGLRLSRTNMYMYVRRQLRTAVPL